MIDIDKYSVDDLNTLISHLSWHADAQEFDRSDDELPIRHGDGDPDPARNRNANEAGNDVGEANETITTGWSFAGVCAAVCIDCVAIVTSFASILDTVTTNWIETVGLATITVCCIAIITLFAVVNRTVAAELSDTRC